MSVKRVIQVTKEEVTKEEEASPLSPKWREGEGDGWESPSRSEGDSGEEKSKNPLPPDPEAFDKPRRRKFTASDKLRILAAADACAQHGEIGALLRREGLYSACLARWRRKRDEGLLVALKPQKRGRKERGEKVLQEKLTNMERRNLRLEEELRKARLIIEVQKKISEILGIPQTSAENDGRI